MWLSSLINGTGVTRAKKINVRTLPKQRKHWTFHSLDLVGESHGLRHGPISVSHRSLIQQTRPWLRRKRTQAVAARWKLAEANFHIGGNFSQQIYRVSDVFKLERALTATSRFHLAWETPNPLKTKPPAAQANRAWDLTKQWLEFPARFPA